MTAKPKKKQPAEELPGVSAFSHAEEAWDIYRLLIENSYDLVGELDVNGDYIYVNPSYTASLGFTQHELLQQNAFGYIHPQDVEKARRELQQQDGTTILRFRHQNGAWKWFDCSFRQFTTPEGFRTVLISRDISARKEAEIKFEVLAALGSRLSGAKTQIEAARVIADGAQTLCIWDAFSLDLYDPAADVIYPVLMVDEIDGKKTEIAPEYQSRSPSPFVRNVLLTGPQRVLRKGNDFDSGLRPFGDTERASASLLFVPIVEEGKPLGIVAVQSYRINAYSRSDLKLLQVLAGHCAGTLARIRAVDNLRDSQARFEAFMENTPGAAWIKDEFGRYIYANDTIEALLKKPRSEVVDKNDSDFLAPDLARQYQQEDAEVRQTGKPLRMEQTLAPTDPQRWFVCRFPFHSPKGGAFVGGLAFDITDQVQMQRSLRASEEKFRTLFESAPVAIGLLNNGQLLFSNSSYRRMFNLPPETGVSGRNFLEDIAPGCRAELEKFLMRPTAASMAATELRGVRSGGSEFPCIIQVAPVELPEGRAHLVFILDISEKRALEAQLFQSQKMESIGRLAGGIAHDFANLVTVIQGHASRIERGIADAGPSLDGIIRAAQKASELTKQLLAFSRKQTVHMVESDLNEVVGQIAPMMERVIGEDITVRLHLGSTLPLIMADKALLEQLVVNLAVTSREAMPTGGNLTVSTFYARPGELSKATSGWDKGAVCLRVEDTGSGFGREDLPQIFEPFYRTRSGMDPSLRLATVYGIVKQHNGHIEVRSELSVGTQFEIFFPATAFPLPAAKTEMPKGDSGTVLVVEDSTELRSLLKEILVEAGYQTLEAATYSAALALFESAREKVSLVIADVCLEDGSGRELVRRLRTIKPSIKAILTTGYDPHQMRGEMDLQPSERFLAKPFQTDELLQQVQQMSQLA